jgi:DNA-directed RNA polymerase subunit M/transcription elongation factor TFIIS
MEDLDLPAMPVMAAPATGNPVHGASRRASRTGELRVLPHEPVCPECGSFEVSIDQVDTGDGIEETAYICEPCGCAWPIACVCEWGPR